MNGKTSKGKANRPVAIQIDRLDKALKAQGVDFKRHQLLEVAAAAFGFRSSNAYTAGIEATVPPMAQYVETIDCSGEAITIARDPLSGSLFGVDESYLEQVSAEERAETWLPTPYGHLIDVNDLLDQPTSRPTPVRPTEGSLGDAYVVASWIEGERLYWNNEDGWVDYASATRFAEIGHSPMTRGSKPIWQKVNHQGTEPDRYPILTQLFGAELVHRAIALAEHLEPIEAEFEPQAWMNDNAITVDADGDTSYDITVAAIAYTLDNNSETIEAYLDAIGDNDQFAGVDTAPTWVSEWQGPFEVHLFVPIATLIADLKAIEAGAYLLAPEDRHEHRWEMIDVDSHTGTKTVACALCGVRDS